MSSVWGSYRNSPLLPTLKFQSRTSDTPRPTSIPSKRPWSGRARWWVDMGCWPRRSWKCWRPLHQNPPSPLWSSWWFPDTSTISPHVIFLKASASYSLTQRKLWVTEHTLFHAGWKWMEKANQTVHFSQPPHGQTAAAEGARQHEAEENPFRVRFNVREPCPVSSCLITSRLYKLAGVITMLGGSLVRMPLHQQTVPASSETLRKNTVRFAATAVRISAHYGPERPRESRAERYCEVQNSLHGSSQPVYPYAARYGCGASLSPPPRRLHILVRAP